MASIGSLVVDLVARTGTFETDLGRAAKASKKASDQMVKDFERIAKAVITLGTAVAVGLTALVKSSLDAADQLNKLSQSSGVSVEKLSALKFAAQQSGVDIDALATGLKKLNVNLSEAAGNAKSAGAIAFKAMGISVKDASGQIKSADQILGEIADKFAGFRDGANKTAIAVQLFGKAGADLIPLLNSGSAGLAKFSDQAQKAGLIISGETAKSAEEFNDKLALLKETLFTGLGNRIAEQLLPTLNDLSDSFLNDADSVSALDDAARVAATGLKFLLDAGLSVGHFFQQLGEQLGAAGAAIVQVLQGNFKEAADIIKARNADGLAADQKFQARLSDIWREGGDDVLKEIKVTATRIKAEAPNLAAGKEIADAAQKSIDKLKDLNQQLITQVATFGLSEDAIIKYRLTLGDLSEEVAKAGKEGKALAASIQEQATKLQDLADTKAIVAALSDVNSQIEQLRGNLAGAATQDFDKQNAELVKQLTRQGNEAGLEQVSTLRKLIGAQAEFNDLVKQTSEIEADLQRTEDRIRNSRDAGAINDIEMQRQLGDARTKSAKDLDAILEKQRQLAKETGNPQIIENVKALGAEIDNLRAQSDLLAQALRTGFEDALGNELADFIDGTKSATDAFRGFIKDIERQITELVAKNLSQSLFKSLFGSGQQGGGSAGSFFSSLAGLFGGGRAYGGEVEQGTLYRVNEREPEYFKPNSGGKVIPLSRMGNAVGVSVTQNIAVSGRPDARTAQQMAVETARRLRLQSARLG